jgi:hypothetical protein
MFGDDTVKPKTMLKKKGMKIKKALCNRFFIII